MAFDLSRRSLMKGVINGSGIAVGVPLLDAFLDVNGEAMAATGAPVPVRFGTWFWGLGVNPNRWFPSKAGPDYELKPELEPIRALKHKINVMGNFNVPLDDAPNLPHNSGGPAIRTGRALTAERGLPGESLDVTIGDLIGTHTRFRSLETSACGGARNSLSGRGGDNLNPAEVSAASLYTRLFGAGFTPDPVVLARRSVLSPVAEQRAALNAVVGAEDRQKLDQYYTSVRQVENQLEKGLTKPDPLHSCIVPNGLAGRIVNAEIENVAKNHELMADLLVMALACDQTRVFNMMFSNSASALTRSGSTVTHHELTHEEVLDTRLGYQPNANYFLTRIMDAWTYFVSALDTVEEGSRTLLDNTLVLAHSDTAFAKFHSIDNIPIMTAGSAGGKLKTGIYVDGAGSPVSRVGLTLQQAMGVPLDRWGARSMETSEAIGEIMG